MAHLMKTLARPPDTRADLEALPEETRAELIRGVLIVAAASPQLPHQRAARRLTVFLTLWAEKGNVVRGEVLGAPFDVALPSGDVVQPDLLFVSSDRLQIVKARGVEGGPDLVVEILSPSNPHYDLFVKNELYAENGVPEYWIVWPDERAIQVLRLEDDAYVPAGWFQPGETLVSATMPDLTIPIDELFPD